MKNKTNTRKSCYCLVLVFIIILIGCTPNPIIIERNITIYNITYINRTIYINDTVPCNVTGPGPGPEINISFDRSYTLELIRRIKFLEGRQDLYWNDTECHYDLNRTEVRLEERELELCENWNTSWC